MHTVPNVHVDGVQARRYTHGDTYSGDFFFPHDRSVSRKSGHAAFRIHRDWQRVRAVSDAGLRSWGREQPRTARGLSRLVACGREDLRLVLPSLLSTSEERDVSPES